jgi:DMSO reductase family type II enzyme iron-sulfur subunit
LGFPEEASFMAKITGQVQMLFDLNKCLGCQTCTSACKTAWTDKDQGQEYMYWNNVETVPGRGYPKGWQTMGGGFKACTNQVDLSAPLPSINRDYGAPWEYNYDEVLTTEGGDATVGMLVPAPRPDAPNDYSSNWDEDVGAGAHPDAYYFYLPRICNHCSKPACVAACPRKAVYKREEDGIVLIDQDRCRGYRYCIKGCPYKKIYWNPIVKKSQKCIFCYPRLENEDPENPLAKNFCVTQCVGRIRWVAYAEDTTSNLYKLVNVWRVGLRLHPEFGTEPNTFYIPPLSPRVTNGTAPRIPTDLLAEMFGDNCSQTFEQRKARVEEVFAILEQERAKVAAGGTSELVDILTSYSESDRIQL